MSNVRAAIQTLIDRWTKECVILVPPSDETEVRRALAELPMPVADDVVDLYCTTGGMVDGYMDDNCLSLWPFSRVIDENRGRSRGDLVFADFLVESHRYSFGYVHKGMSSVHFCNPDDSQFDYRVSPSAAEFFRHYAEASDEHTAFHVLHEG